MKKPRHVHIVDSLFLLVIFFIFTLCTLVVLAMGANTYKQISKNMTERYNKTTAFAYITTKVRHYDALGKVYITEFDGKRVLALEESVDGTAYVTFIYAHDDRLMELSKQAGESSLHAEDGAELVNMKALNLERPADNLLHLTAVFSDNHSEELWLYLSSL